LLGAYDVSGGKYPLLLQKADQLGEFLFQAIDTQMASQCLITGGKEEIRDWRGRLEF
jgi:hypothetical protein